MQIFHSDSAEGKTSKRREVLSKGTAVEVLVGFWSREQRIKLKGEGWVGFKAFILLAQMGRLCEYDSNWLCEQGDAQGKGCDD